MEIDRSSLRGDKDATRRQAPGGGGVVVEAGGGESMATPIEVVARERQVEVAVRTCPAPD